MSRVLVNVECDILAPIERVRGYVLDFENAREWMVGIEGIERISEDDYRLVIETPVGRLKPEASVAESRQGRIRWIYTSALEGEGRLDVLGPGDGSGCTVRYRGDFSIGGGILGRAAKLVGMEDFARRQGERSLERLKSLMEAGRY